LYNEHDELISPSEIYYEDLLKSYPKCKIIEDFFNFKPSLLKNLPKEIQIKLEIIEGIPINHLLAVVDAYHREHEDKTVITPVDISEIDVPIEEVTFHNSRIGIDEDDLNKEENQNKNENEITDDPSSLNNIMSDLYGNDNPSVEDKYTVKKDTSKKRKEIGQWGEKLVFKQIREEYVKKGYKIKNETEFSFSALKNEVILTVTHQNNDKKIQNGYDISVKCGDETLEFIEVKSSEEETDNFDVSGTQWEFSKTLFNKSEGQKYHLYFVTNARKSQAKIRKYCNPYQEWLNGNIEADPIRVRI
jgi:hypothetical protein